jgi:outer membrane biosynthesis protein TonB
MRQALGFIASALIHFALVASAFIAFPQAARYASDSVIIPVELVTLSDVTNVRAARPEPEPVRPEPEPEPVTPAPETQPEIITQPEPIPLPPEPQPEPQPEPEPEPAPEPEPEPAREPEPAPPPAPRPQPRPQPQPERGLDLDDLSRLVDRSRQETRQRPAEEGEARRGAGEGTAMTATLQDMLRSQIARCTRSNADAPSNMDLRVVVEVRLERSGALSSPPRLRDEARVMNSSNPFLRVAGERAVRAVIDCQPYRLPPEAYGQWRHLEVMVDTQAGR